MFFVVLRIMLGLLFVISGGQKLLSHYQNFLYVIQSYDLVHFPLDMWVAKTMPWAELILGLFVIAGLWTRVSLTGLWVLSTTFIFVLTQALIRHLPIESCGCFGGMFAVPLPVMLSIDCVIWSSLLLLILKIDQARKFSFDQSFS